MCLDVVVRLCFFDVCWIGLFCGFLCCVDGFNVHDDQFVDCCEAIWATVRVRTSTGEIGSAVARSVGVWLSNERWENGGVMMP